MMATSAIVGTPAYMAPEQVEGRETTPAADIYGLGVVLYEMVTGRLPFSGDTPLSVAVKRLTETPQTPRRHVPDLDPAWEAAILRCLARDPADRFASAADVTRALRGEIPIQAPNVHRRRRRLAIAGAALMLAVLGGTFVAFQVRRTTAGAPDPQTNARAIVPRRSVAVLGFKNLSGRADAAWLSSALAEMFTSELAAGEKLRTIPGENVAQMKVNLALTDAESFGRETLARIRTNLGTDLVVLGSYVALGAPGSGQIRLDLRLQDAALGETVASVTDTGREEEGRLAEAKTMYEDSLAIAREIGSKPRLGYTLTRLGGILRLTGDRAAARTTLEEALAVRTAIAAKGDIAETRLALASLTLEDGRAGGAEALARQAAEEFQREKMIDREAEAYDRMARALLVQGKTADGRAAIERASSLAAKSQDRRVRLSIDVTRARARAAAGATADAIKSLESTLVDAKNAGFLDLEFDVRLALGEIETQSSRQAAGLARLTALEKDAAALGFGLIAKKAADVRGARAGAPTR